MSTRRANLGFNENCFGPSPKAIRACKKILAKSNLYNTSASLELVLKICEHHKDFDISTDQIILGSGSNELIFNLVRLLEPDNLVIYGWPSFNMYRTASVTNNKKHIGIPLLADLNYDLENMLLEIKKNNKIKLVFLPNPNNPTGQIIEKEKLKNFAKKLPKDIILVIDEAYFEYVKDNKYETALNLNRPNTIVLRTFSKIYGLAAMRLGYAIGDREIISTLYRIRDPLILILWPNMLR
jgi:histidinol-phosphate aminotransferase